MRVLSVGLLVAAIVAGVPVAVAQQADIDVSEELESGLLATPSQRAAYYLAAGEWDKLRAHAQRWARDFPGESEAWHYLALARRQAGDVAGAAKDFERAWELSERRDYKIIEDIGDIYMQVEDWSEAESAYRQATEIRPGRAELWHKLGGAIMARPFDGRVHVAAPVLKKTLLFGQYVNNYQLWRQYAEALDEIGRDLDAQYNAYRHVVRLKPADIPAWERLYKIEQERGNEAGVRKIVKKLFRLDARNVYANLYYGERALDDGHPAQARQYYETALQHRNVSSIQRGDIYLALAEMDTQSAAALAFYQRAIANNPKLVTAWERAIVILRNTRRRAEAQRYHEALGVVERHIRDKKPVPGELLKKLNLTAR